MLGGVGVDVGYGGVDARYFGRIVWWRGWNGLYGEDEVEEFGVVVRRGRVLQEDDFGFEEGSGEGRFGVSVAAERDAFGEKGTGDCGEDGLEGLAMYEESFEGVAGGCIPAFGVYYYLHGFCRIGVLVDVGAAETVGVAQDRDFGVVFDVGDELVGAAGDNKVDVRIER